MAALPCVLGVAPAQANAVFSITPSIVLPSSPGNNVYLGDTITGSFVWDGTKVTSVDFVATGKYNPTLAGPNTSTTKVTYNTLASSFNSPAGNLNEISACAAGLCSKSIDILHLFFQNPVGTQHDQIVSVSWDGAAKVTPSSTSFAVPEPASLSLMGFGLLAAGFIFTRRRKQPVAAA